MKIRIPAIWQSRIADSILYIAVACITLGVGAWLSLLDK